MLPEAGAAQYPGPGKGGAILEGVDGESKPDWKDFLALVLATYSLLLPPLLLILGALFVFLLLLRFLL